MHHAHCLYMYVHEYMQYYLWIGKYYFDLGIFALQKHSNTCKEDRNNKIMEIEVSPGLDIHVWTCTPTV